jgi:hypothetical protein
MPEQAFAVLQPMPLKMYEDTELVHSLMEGIWEGYLELARGVRISGPLLLQQLGQLPGEDEGGWWVRITGPAVPDG